MKNISVTNNSNSGFSLVELIAAVAVGAIIASAVAGLISFSVRMYANQKRDTELQKEIQTTLNQVVDSAVSASWFCVDNNATKTGYAAFGKLVEKTESGSTNLYFVGELIVTGADGAGGATSGRFNIYMNRYVMPTGASGENTLQVSDAADAKAKLKSVATANSLIDDIYLIGTDATKFLIKMNKANVKETATPYIYTNPMSFGMEMTFVRDGYGKTITKSIADDVSLRNHMVNTVYYGDAAYSYKKKLD